MYSYLYRLREGSNVFIKGEGDLQESKNQGRRLIFAGILVCTYIKNYYYYTEGQAFKSTVVIDKERKKKAKKNTHCTHINPYKPPFPALPLSWISKLVRLLEKVLLIVIYIIKEDKSFFSCQKVQYVNVFLTHFP